MLFTSKQQGKTAKESPKFPTKPKTGENHMITFFEAKTKNQNLELKVEENMNTGYDFKELNVTVQDLTVSQRLALKKVARNYEAKTKETNKELTLTLAIEPQDTQEEWVNTIMTDIKQQEIKETLELGTTYKVEEKDETIKTLQIVTAQDLDGTDFNRKQELTQQEKEDDTLGQAFSQFLRINEPLARDQQNIKINQQLTNTSETIRIHYPTITGHNSELITIIERTYTKTTPTEVTINNKKTKQGAIGNYYTVENGTNKSLIEIATFEDITNHRQDFEPIIESMNLYTTPDFKEFWEKNWSHYPTITKQRNKTAQQFVELAEEAINETLDYTSNMTTYNMEDLHNHTIAHTYTDKMNPNTYIFIIIREYK